MLTVALRQGSDKSFQGVMQSWHMPIHYTTANLIGISLLVKVPQKWKLSKGKIGHKLMKTITCRKCFQIAESAIPMGSSVFLHGSTCHRFPSVWPWHCGAIACRPCPGHCNLNHITAPHLMSNKTTGSTLYSGTKVCEQSRAGNALFMFEIAAWIVCTQKYLGTRLQTCHFQPIFEGR